MKSVVILSRILCIYLNSFKFSFSLVWDKAQFSEYSMKIELVKNGLLV